MHMLQEIKKNASGAFVTPIAGDGIPQTSHSKHYFR